MVAFVKRLECHTCEVHIARNFWQWRIDQLFEIHFLVLDVEKWLTRSQARLSKSQWSRGIIAVEGLDIQHLERKRHIVDRQRRSSSRAHKTQSLYDDLSDSVLDVLGERLEGFFVEGVDADGFGDVLDVLWVPEKLWRRLVRHDRDTGFA